MEAQARHGTSPSDGGPTWRWLRKKDEWSKWDERHRRQGCAGSTSECGQRVSFNDEIQKRKTRNAQRLTSNAE
jgi:hypothetical protein